MTQRMLINLILFCFFMFILGIGVGKLKKEKEKNEAGLREMREKYQSNAVIKEEPK